MDDRMPESLNQALQSLAAQHIQQDGWFDAGLERIRQLQEALIDTEDLCWYVPKGTLGPIQSFAEPHQLAGLPVYEVPAGVPVGLGLVLPRCSGTPDCPVHPEPTRLELYNRTWEQWADRHRRDRSQPCAECLRASGHRMDCSVGRGQHRG